MKPRIVVGKTLVQSEANARSRAKRGSACAKALKMLSFVWKRKMPLQIDDNILFLYERTILWKQVYLHVKAQIKNELEVKGAEWN